MKLAVATLVTALLASSGLILFADAIGFIGRVIIGLAIELPRWIAEREAGAKRHARRKRRGKRAKH